MPNQTVRGRTDPAASQRRRRCREKRTLSLIVTVYRSIASSLSAPRKRPEVSGCRCITLIRLRCGNPSQDRMRWSCRRQYGGLPPASNDLRLRIRSQKKVDAADWPTLETNRTWAGGMCRFGRDTRRSSLHLAPTVLQKAHPYFQSQDPEHCETCIFRGRQWHHFPGQVCHGRSAGSEHCDHTGRLRYALLRRNRLTLEVKVTKRTADSRRPTQRRAHAAGCSGRWNPSPPPREAP